MLKTLGKNPGDRIKKSPNYKKDAFVNKEDTVMLKGANIFSMAKLYLNQPKSVTPKDVIPHIKSDLKSDRDPKEVHFTWFGHSSYLLQYSGLNILVDPVLNGSASPVPFFVQAFNGTDSHSASDLPDIDLLILTHDHYDHLDYKTIMELKPKVKNIITSLGVASHLHFWGLDKNNIKELDWGDRLVFNDKLSLHSETARHFSGRNTNRNQTLWSSFILEFNDKKIYVGGDSGYGKHFKDIGAKFGSFDLVILECGQYGKFWPQIHMRPFETAQAASDLNARAIFPVHWGKFKLSVHPWKEPIEWVLKEADKKNIPVYHSMIGECLKITGKPHDDFWWKKVN